MRVLASVTMLGLTLLANINTTSAQFPIVNPEASRLTSASLSQPSAVYRRYATAPKGEFETTEAYASRLAKIRVPAGFLAFSVDGSCSTDDLVSYDADGSYFTIKLPVGDRVVGLTCANTPLGAYQAQNAFGASFTVKKFHRLQYAVSFPDAAPAELYLPFPLDSARRAKPSMRVALIVKMYDPAVAVADTSRAAPTFDSPLDLTIQTNAIALTRAYIWLYNASTGRVRWPRKSERVG
jgi:hypothetical protein